MRVSSHAKTSLTPAKPAFPSPPTLSLSGASRHSLEYNWQAIRGDDAPDALGNAVIRSVGQPGAAGLRITLAGVFVSDLSVNGAFDVITLSRGSLAEQVQILDSQFERISGSVLSADAETEDYGRYNVDRVDIHRSRFLKIGGAVAALYRGATDESTFGPFATVSDCVIENVGLSARNRSDASLLFHGVQHTSVHHNQFRHSAPIIVRHTVGLPQTTIADNQFVDTATPRLEELNYKGESRATLRDNRMTGEPAQ